MVPDMADFLKTHLLEDISIVSVQVSLLDADGLGAITRQRGRQLVQPKAIGRPQEILGLEVLQVQRIGDVLQIRICEVGDCRGRADHPHQDAQTSNNTKVFWGAHHDDEVSWKWSTLKSLQISAPNLINSEPQETVMEFEMEDRVLYRRHREVQSPGDKSWQSVKKLGRRGHLHVVRLFLLAMT